MSPDLTVPAARAPNRRAVALWLFACCVMIFVMVVLGGVTRLTHSGLSMVEWRPVTGWLPPLTESAWQVTFERYQAYPEFHKLNRDMTLSGFKSIFWLEYLHRIWGRLIGFVFLLPLVFFWLKGCIRGQLISRLLAIFALGAAQGVMGWYMVMSGLIDRPDVSQYRLSAHLALAFLLYAYIFWVALDLLGSPTDTAGAADPQQRRGIYRACVCLLGLVAATVIFGGFVAGLDAGFAYNTFPLMGGRWVPEYLFAMQPVMRNFFENIATVQFTHRILAISCLVFAAAVWLWGRGLVLSPRTRVCLHTMMLVVAVQVSLGIATLLLVVPIALAAAHQAGALLVVSSLLWLIHELRRDAARGA